jgi:hypothetical protein
MVPPTGLQNECPSALGQVLSESPDPIDWLTDYEEERRCGMGARPKRYLATLLSASISKGSLRDHLIYCQVNHTVYLTLIYFSG